MAKKTIKLFLVDEDSIFRLGFTTALSAYPDFKIVAQEDNLYQALKQLEEIAPDVMVLELSSKSYADKISSWQLCQQLRQQYPGLPILLLTALEPKLLTSAKALGIEGYCAKGEGIETIVAALTLVAAGEFYWQTAVLPRPNVWQITLSRFGRSGMGQIQAEMEKINYQLKATNLSPLDHLFWSGRKRELLAAHWLINRIVSGKEGIITKSNSTLTVPQSALAQPQLLPPPELTLAPIAEDSLAAKIFKRTLILIELGLINCSGIPLEIDILQLQKRQELFYLVLDKLIEMLKQLRRQANLATALDQAVKLIWEETVVAFFFSNSAQTLAIKKEDLRQIFRQDITTIEENIFIHLYWLLELFTYLIKEKPILIDNVPYRPESPEAIAHVELLLQNVIVLIANAVMQALLNNFSDLEIFKYKLYQPCFRTSREIARFRNGLSWRYRQEKYWENPKNIFTSRYRLFVWQRNSIQTLFIYAPRTKELEQLQGLPWLTTIALEARDAISPLLRSVLGLAGTSVVYILTQVVGRGIGLIGKGIIQGIGSTLQDQGVENRK